jgi:hypothetical protein
MQNLVPTLYLPACLEGLLLGKIFVLPLSRTPLKRPVPGLYSGIFFMHFQHCTFNNGPTDNLQRNIISYAICVLYVLSVAVVALDMISCLTDVSVSNNELFFHFALISCVER